MNILYLGTFLLCFSNLANGQVGTLDSSFGNNGVLFSDYRSFDKVDANNKIIQPDGKTVIVGVARGRLGNDFCITRYNPDGSLDNSFSEDGQQTTDFGSGNDIAYSVAIQGDKIIVAGCTSSTGNSMFAIARYNANGSLDPTFSGDGRLTTDFSAIAVCNAVVTQGNKILVAGYCYTSKPVIESDFIIARYNDDGTLDKTFSNDGIQKTDFFGYGDYANSMAIQGDKIVVAGDAVYTNTGYLTTAIARYNNDGSLDKTFSDDGLQTTGISSSASLIIQQDKILVAGYGTDDFIVFKYNFKGSLDEAFGNNGIQRTHFGTNYYAQTNSITMEEEKLIITGNVYDFKKGIRQLVMARYK
ncbi:hypothetical protein [Segetibacter sp.]|jgi:uncharacterized delta-60 repeat protein|uniref:hypothetical protein n=1 Tax=Segetibacter sp. TaxID=2231182 RepID=UPI0026063AD4|nr:hypothetical protein [Segetibacter sp.]MCW3080808.1 hypothetical protein [Segetibacter sp.]